MGKVKKYSQDFQQKEVSLGGKTRKVSSICNIKRLVWWERKINTVWILQYKEVSLLGKARKPSRISSIKRSVWREKQGNIVWISSIKRLVWWERQEK